MTPGPALRNLRYHAGHHRRSDVSDRQSPDGWQDIAFEGSLRPVVMIVPPVFSTELQPLPSHGFERGAARYDACGDFDLPGFHWIVAELDSLSSGGQCFACGFECYLGVGADA